MTYFVKGVDSNIDQYNYAISNYTVYVNNTKYSEYKVKSIEIKYYNYEIDDTNKVIYLTGIIDAYASQESVTYATQLGFPIYSIEFNKKIYISRVTKFNSALYSRVNK
jgi:hypothetical protein